MGFFPLDLIKFYLINAGWGYKDSYSSSSTEVKAQERPVINWTLLRENKDKYEAQKWAGLCLFGVILQFPFDL